MKEFAPEIIQLVDQVIDPDTLCKVNLICKNHCLFFIFRRLCIIIVIVNFIFRKLCIIVIM